MAKITLPGCLPFMLAVLLAGCGRAGEPPAPAVPVAQAPQAPGAADDGEPFDLAWQGVLPCADCAGIRTRLRLRRDVGGHAFELEETYMGAEDDNVFSTSGAWRLERAGAAQAGAPVYRLGTEGGALGFELQTDGSLQLLGADGAPPADAIAYRLHRL